MALSRSADPNALDLAALADSLIRKSVWIVGGDGWAYDIGFGGLDHVLASGQNVKLLVLDTEVYSNTGGQRSKATPRGAVARFAAGGKETAKKDLALIAMSYGNTYVARVSLGANDTQTLQAFEEAEAFDGPAIIIAFGPCIAHGYDLKHSLEQQKHAVQSGYWPLFTVQPGARRGWRKPPRARLEVTQPAAHRVPGRRAPIRPPDPRRVGCRPRAASRGRSRRGSAMESLRAVRRDAADEALMRHIHPTKPGAGACRPADGLDSARSGRLR